VRKLKKLNLGSGLDYREGWVNVDCNKEVKADVYALAHELPFENEEFDYVLASHVLEHIWSGYEARMRGDGLEHVLREIHRVLKWYGTFVTEIPSHLSEGAVRKDHYYIISLRGYKRKFYEAGFTVEKVRGVGGSWIQFLYPIWWLLGKVHPWFANSWLFTLTKTHTPEVIKLKGDWCNV
jgi:SAM-dependent methyltransferase